MGNYLVILGSHVNTIDKKNMVLETLKYFEDNDIDVCYSTHCGDFLGEISHHVKFISYDRENEFLTLQDYLDNSKFIDEKNPFQYGISNWRSHYDFGTASINMSGSPHTRSALSLLKNGIFFSKCNNYKWTIYLEYDTIQPKEGFKNYIEGIIERLESEEKKCFYYHNSLDRFKFLWGGICVFDTDSLFSYDKLMRGKWSLDKENWFKEWNLGFFESVLEYSFSKTFSPDKILSESIQDKAGEVWGVDDFFKISLFSYTSVLYKEGSDEYLRKNLHVYLYPELDESKNIKVHLLYHNMGNFETSLDEILVYSDNFLHLNMKKIKILPYHWSIFTVDITSLDPEDVIHLIWTGRKDKSVYSGKQSVKVENIESIEKNVMRINFNS